MPEYKYQAQDSNGRIIKGKAEAFDDTDLQKRKDVISQLLPSRCGSIGKTILDSILLS